MSRLELLIQTGEVWRDPVRAPKAVQEFSLLSKLKQIEKRISDAIEMLTSVDNCLGLLEEIVSEVASIEEELDSLEIDIKNLDVGTKTPQATTYNSHSTILIIHAGTGGVEAQDFAHMLQRMYLRWAEKHGFNSEVLYFTPGSAAGLKKCYRYCGKNIYDLRSEHGVHRLVRYSPFDKVRRPQTSFALVEVLPQMVTAKVQILPQDIRIDTFKAAGAGGQNVQKNATAVRITHIPTGVRVSCQDTRSLTQNKACALKILRARLLAQEQRAQKQELSQLRGHTNASWGNKIRSYILHSHKIIKDHRTGHQERNTNAVLDGEVDGFIKAYLQWITNAHNSPNNNN